ncbi:hypothetical protein [Nocardia pneumoniae]|nr:hypothetical protein [Nocardia pneumoniae]
MSGLTSADLLGRRRSFRAFNRGASVPYLLGRRLSAPDPPTLLPSSGIR